MTDVSQFYRWLNLRRVYRAVFWLDRREPKLVKSVLDELREFCAPDSVPLRIGKDGHTDMYQTGIVAGRVEVWLRIQSILNLSDDALNKMKELENDH